MDIINEQLKASLLRMVPEAGKHATAIEGLTLTRWNDTHLTDTCFYAPSIGVIVQGRKESLIGSEKLVYGEYDCLVNGVDMPSISHITTVSPETPLLAVSLAINSSLVTELAAEAPASLIFPDTHCLGVSLAKVTPDVLETFSRLVDLLDKPGQIPLMAPLFIREILFRTLVGPQGGALRMIYTRGSHSNQVAQAITWLQKNYREPLHIDALADSVDMATSSFHRQFKKVTSLSPLQYQKRLRLYEAQRLMLSGNIYANDAGRAVGYENIQQFNREYKRMFGEPPHKHVNTLRLG